MMHGGADPTAGLTEISGAVTLHTRASNDKPRVLLGERVHSPAIATSERCSRLVVLVANGSTVVTASTPQRVAAGHDRIHGCDCEHARPVRWSHTDPPADFEHATVGALVANGSTR